MSTTLLRPVPPLAVEILDDEAGLRTLETEWDDLFAAAGRPSLCASHAWACAWWQAYGRRADGAGQDTEVFILAVREEGRLVGVVPFVEDRSKAALAVRRLRPLGFVGQNRVFDMTEEPTLLARVTDVPRVLAAVAESLREGLAAGRWDAVHLRLHADPATAPLQAAFGGLMDQAKLRVDQRCGSDYAELPETWAAYRKAMSRSMRDNLPYYPKLLTRDGHDWQVRLLRRPEEMTEAIERLAELHRARAASDKGRRHDAHLQGSVQEAFLAGLLRRFAAQGGATVAELVVGGEVVASQAFVEAGGTMMVSYSGYREAWYKYSPIFVIDAVVFRDALERGVRRLDFLRNPAPWKTRWLAAPGPAMHRMTLLSRRPESRLRYALFVVEQAVRRDVVGRLPVLARRFREIRATVERAVLPAVPWVGRVGLRAMPTAHWAALQLPLHHR